MKLNEAITMVEDIQNRLGWGTRNGIAEKMAAENYINPNACAFCWTATYSDAWGGTFAQAVNRHRGDIAETIAEYWEECSMNLSDPRLLDVLIPLNDRSADALAKAYADAGRLVTRTELMARLDAVEVA